MIQAPTSARSPIVNPQGGALFKSLRNIEARALSDFGDIPEGWWIEEIEATVGDAPLFLHTARFNSGFTDHPFGKDALVKYAGTLDSEAMSHIDRKPAKIIPLVFEVDSSGVFSINLYPDQSEQDATPAIAHELSNQTDEPLPLPLERATPIEHLLAIFAMLETGETESGILPVRYQLSFAKVLQPTNNGQGTVQTNHQNSLGFAR